MSFKGIPMGQEVRLWTKEGSIKGTLQEIDKNNNVHILTNRGHVIVFRNHCKYLSNGDVILTTTTKEAVA